MSKLGIKPVLPASRLVAILSVAALSVVVLVTLNASTAAAQTPDTDLVFEFTFDGGTNGWVAGFADLPADFDQATYELDSGVRALPEGLSGNGYSIQGHNRSDDLFMYVARYVDGLQPSTDYAVSAEVDFATNVPAASFGIGGSPGKSVYVKAGATATEPSEQQDGNGWLRSNVDKGNRSNGGESMVVIGNVSHPEVVSDEYKLKTVATDGDSVSVTTDDTGELWLIVGTDSGFEGLTALYYTRIAFAFSVRPSPSVAKITGTIDFTEAVELTADAVSEVSLVDVSHADASAITIAALTIEEPGHAPIAFELEYDPSLIDDRFTYAVQARVTENTELAFINDIRYAVITRDSPTHVAMVLIRVGDPAPSVPPNVGGLSVPGWLLGALGIVGALIVAMGTRALASTRPVR